MQRPSPTSPAVVVGVDGSRASIDAALWAVPEAVDREIPLRLVYAIEDPDTRLRDGRTYTQDSGTADSALRAAITAVESTSQPVKIESEITHGQATNALLAASHSAAMVCVGALGLNGAAGRHGGSTAANLVSRAHQPVAVIRRAVPHDGVHSQWIVAEFDGDPACTAVIERAVDEARLRHAPLRVLTRWRPMFTDIHDTRGAADGKRMTKANLERALEHWRRSSPEIDIEAVAVNSSVLGYVAHNVKTIQLVVIGSHRQEGLAEFVGPAANAALHDTNCSLLILEQQRQL